MEVDSSQHLVLKVSSCAAAQKAQEVATEHEKEIEEEEEEDDDDDDDDQIVESNAADRFQVCCANRKVSFSNMAFVISSSAEKNSSPMAAASLVAQQVDILDVVECPSRRLPKDAPQIILVNSLDENNSEDGGSSSCVSTPEVSSPRNSFVVDEVDDDDLVDVIKESPRFHKLNAKNEEEGLSGGRGDAN